MKTNPLKQLHALGQSVWLDHIRRDMIESGALMRMIEDDGVRGLTSNPAIFEKAIAQSREYDADIAAMIGAGKRAKDIYEALTQNDVRWAADNFRSLYDESLGDDGYVSLEVDPHLAYDTQGTIEEARRLWGALNRPNVLIKVPATSAGLIAITQLVSEGINVNVTLIFGLPRYREVTLAYLAGLESRVAQGQCVKHLVSVASFFLSRIDTLFDVLLEKACSDDRAKTQHVQSVLGCVAVASAKAAYQIYQETFAGARFKKLTDKGARAQRLLWASTGNKNPAYSDVKYVESVIGAETINTMPLETLNAYRDHGQPIAWLEKGVSESEIVLSHLALLGINIDEATQQLEDEGVEKFQKPFDALMEVLANGKKK